MTQGVGFRGVGLRGLDLGELDLGELDLEELDLREVDLKGIDLWEMDLWGLYWIWLRLLKFQVFNRRIHMGVEPVNFPLNTPMLLLHDITLDQVKVYQTRLRCHRVLCSTIKEFVAKVASVKDDEQVDPISTKCNSLIQKLDALLNALRQETSQESDNVISSNLSDLIYCHLRAEGKRSDSHTRFKSVNERTNERAKNEYSLYWRVAMDI